MTKAEKIACLSAAFDQLPNVGVLTWGPIPGGFQWTCDSEGRAYDLARYLVPRLQMAGVDGETLPFRVEPHQFGGRLIIEPVDD